MDNVKKGFLKVCKLHIILAVTLLLLATTGGADCSPGRRKNTAISQNGKKANTNSDQGESSLADNPFTLWFDAINSPTSTDKLYEDEEDQPEDLPISLWFDSIESETGAIDNAKPEIKPTKVVNLPQRSTSLQNIVPSSSIVVPTVTVTVFSTVVVPTIIRLPPVTSTMFITVLPDEVAGSMDSFFREMAKMTAVMRAKMATLHKENKELVEKVIRLSRPSLIIDNLRQMPPHKRKLLIARMEKLMKSVSMINDKRYRQDPVVLKVNLEQLANHLEDLNPLIFRK